VRKPASSWTKPPTTTNSRPIEEIRADPALRIYGAAIGAAHALAFLAWGRSTGPRIADPATSICWPFFEDCFAHRWLSGDGWTAVIFAGGLLSCAAAALFPWRERTAAAWALLLGAEVLRLLVLAQDYSLRLNQHYFLSFASLIFLFVPGKRNLLRYYLVFLYVWAGILKLDVEWLSGAALYRDPLFVPKALIPASCVYVVVMECLFSWGLLSRVRWIFWGALAQLCLFHLVSFSVVGFYYPLLMFLLLTVFPLTRFLESAEEPESLLGSLLRGAQPRSTYAFLLLFSLLQLVPRAIPGDEALTGEGRVFAIHMFDARVVCRGAITVRFADRPAVRFEIPNVEATRIRCDPAVYFSQARRRCWENRDAPGFIDVDLFMESRRQTEDRLETVVDEPDFCARAPTYTMLWRNDWIRRR
jgi:hypothetical protein